MVFEIFLFFFFFFFFFDFQLVYFLQHFDQKVKHYLKKYHYQSWVLYITSHFRKVKTCVFHCFPTLHRKWSFLLRISSENVIKFAENCGFGHRYWRKPYSLRNLFYIGSSKNWTLSMHSYIKQRECPGIRTSYLGIYQPTSLLNYVPSGPSHFMYLCTLRTFVP